MTATTPYDAIVLGAGGAGLMCAGVAGQPARATFIVDTTPPEYDISFYSQCALLMPSMSPCQGCGTAMACGTRCGTASMACETGASMCRAEGKTLA